MSNNVVLHDIQGGFLTGSAEKSVGNGKIPNKKGKAKLAFTFLVGIVPFPNPNTFLGRAS